MAKGPNSDHDISAFYIGGTFFMGLDSDEIDDLLAQNEMSVETHAVRECAAYLRSIMPRRTERMMRTWRGHFKGKPEEN